MKINQKNSKKAADASLPPDEYQTIIYEWNNTHLDFAYEKTLPVLFEEQVSRTPHHVALRFGQQQMTYLALNQAANQVARLIQSHAHGEKDLLIALYLDRSLEMVIGLLGILKAGAAYVPIDPHYPSERIEYILNDIQSPLILTQTQYVQALQSLTHRNAPSCIALDNQPYQHLATNNLELEISPHALAYVIYTSGTTGKPKGVTIPHCGIVNRLDWMQRAYPLHTDDVVLHKTPYSFDVSVWELLWAHQVGATLVIAEPKGHQNPIYLIDLIKHEKVSVIHFVPSMLSAFLHSMQGARLPNSLRFVFCSGEALAANQVAAFYEQSDHDVELHNLYGPTEASIDVTAFPCTRETTNVLIGKPIQNTQAYILDEKLNPLPIGEVGELYLGGVGLARGYLNQPELTDARFITNPFSESADARLYKTGDLARWLKDGNLEYLGRNDFQVKIRGHRIELGEIESTLNTYAAIRQSIVIVQQPENGLDMQPYLVAYYVSDDAIPERDLTTHLKQHIPEYMLPGAFMHLSHFPLTTNGKLDRKALPVHAFASNEAHYCVPNNALQEQLVALWCQELGLTQVGIHDHFLALGGHSLSAARIVSSIHFKLNKQLSLNQFYASGTIAELSTVITEQRLEQTEAPQKILAKHKKIYPLNDFQLMLWLSDLFEPKAKKMNIVTRRRIQGELDVRVLRKAFHALFADQKSLSFRIAKFYPAQLHQEALSFDVVETPCGHLPIQDFELILHDSFYQLLNVYPWSPDYPLVMARVFHLPNQVTELQLCMPHLIADEFSMDVLCEHLSENYLNLVHQTPGSGKTAGGKFQKIAPYEDYVLNEQQTNTHSLDQKLSFWEQYLHNTRLFDFPKQHVVKNMQALKLDYSTYIEIPEHTLTRLKQFCTRHQVNLIDTITAILAQTLSDECDTADHLPASALINLVKSTRDNPQYDQTIGCFVRVDPIKINLQNKPSVVELSKQVHHTIMESAPHQHCSTLLKLAYLTRCFQKKTKMLSWITRTMMPVYSKLLRAFSVDFNNERIFKFCWRLAGYDRKSKFIVILNLWNSFVTDKKNSNEALFGQPTIQSPLTRYELSTMDYILDVCFLRDSSLNKTPYLVISSNLEPSFRAHLGRMMIQRIKQLDAQEHQVEPAVI